MSDGYEAFWNLAHALHRELLGALSPRVDVLDWKDSGTETRSSALGLLSDTTQ